MSEQGQGKPSEPEAELGIEREKWVAERKFREREIAVKEGEQRVREQDLQIRQEELSRSRWRNPLVVAIFAAAAAGLGNGVVAFVNGHQAQRLERTREESARILEMIKTGNADKAAENLRFLMDAGLIGDPERIAAIRHFLSTRTPGSGPSLPSFGAPAFPENTISKLSTNDPLRVSASAIGSLRVGTTRCIAFSAAPGLVLALGSCLNVAISQNATTGTFVSGGRFASAGSANQVALPPRDVLRIATDDGTYEILLIALAEQGDRRRYWVSLANVPPSSGLPLRFLTYADLVDAPTGIAVASDTIYSSCEVTDVKENYFLHNCSGEVGTPLLSEDGRRVVGVVVDATRGHGVALRADRILDASKALQTSVETRRD